MAPGQVEDELGLQWGPSVRGSSKAEDNSHPHGGFIPRICPTWARWPHRNPRCIPTPRASSGGFPTTRQWALPRHRMGPGVMHRLGCRRGHSMGISGHITPAAPCSAGTQQLPWCSRMSACFGKGKQVWEGAQQSLAAMELLHTEQSQRASCFPSSALRWGCSQGWLWGMSPPSRGEVVEQPAPT